MLKERINLSLQDQLPGLQYTLENLSCSLAQKSFIFGYRQVCVYGYPKKVLEVFLKNKKKTKLEQIEDIEILRFLELGFRVKMVELSDGSISVDTMSDVKKVSNKLSNAKKN